MNRYVLKEQIGQGTFGIVFRATKKEEPECGKHYAVKKLKQTFSSWKDVVIEREFKAIEIFMTSTAKKRSPDDGTGDEKHPFDLHHADNDGNYLVRVFEVLRERDSSLYFVMEYMKDGNLQAYIAAKSKFKLGSPVHKSQSPENNHAFHESETRSILYQVFRGLRHIHSLGYIHRDIKPENVLLHGRIAKLADFSLARPVGSLGRYRRGEHSTNFHKGARTRSRMTNYIGTRWYRAPELLLKAPTTASANHGGGSNGNDANDRGYYTEAIDLFAMGCVAAELYRCRPLFQGKDETEQLQLIENLLLINPSSSDIHSDGLVNDDYDDEEGQSAPARQRLAREIETADPQTVHFIFSLLYLRPEKRMNAREVLCLEYFRMEHMAIKSIPCGLDSIPNATKVTEFCKNGTPRSTAIFSPSNDNNKIGNTHSPRVLGNTVDAAGETNHSLRVLPSVRITPIARTSNAGLNMNTLIGSHVTENNYVNLYEVSPGDKIIGSRKQALRTIHRSNLQRKRSKLHPSQVFQID